MRGSCLRFSHRPKMRSPRVKGLSGSGNLNMNFGSKRCYGTAQSHRLLLGVMAPLAFALEGRVSHSSCVRHLMETSHAKCDPEW